MADSRKSGKWRAVMKKTAVRHTLKAVSAVFKCLMTILLIGVITATMVGNYARQGVIPRPEGKRYGREHAAYLIFVCLSKQVIAIGDIQQLIALQRRTEFNVAVAYDYFCTEMESILAHVFNGAPLRPDSSRTHARETHLVRSAGFAVAHKIYLSQYLRYLRAQESETQPSGG